MTRRRVFTVLASNYFFYGVLVVAALQALWYIVSFQPGINDELRHMGAIQAYAQHLTPFFSDDPKWDYLGQLSREGSYLFYYLMSWPYRLIQLFTDNYQIQVMLLRLINAAFFIGGLVIYRRVLLLVGRTSKSAINLLILLFVLIPAAGLLAGMVSYDNLIFLMFAAVLLMSVRILRARKLDARSLVLLLILGLLMCIVKWTAIALFAPVALFIAYHLLKQHGRALPVQFLTAAKRLPRLQLGLLLAGLAIAGLLFIERPVVNSVRFGSPDVWCDQVISRERCLNWSTYASYDELANQKPADFEPQDPARYFFNHWLPTVTIKASNLVEGGDKTVLPVSKLLYYMFAYIVLALVLVRLSVLTKNRYHRFFLFTVVLSTAILLADEYLGYLKYGEPVAIRARYLVPVLPLILYLALAALPKALKRRTTALLVAAAVLIVVSLQGGSIITQLFTAPESAYWQQSRVVEYNDDLKRLLDPVIIR